MDFQLGVPVHAFSPNTLGDQGRGTVRPGGNETNLDSKPNLVLKTMAGHTLDKQS